MSANRLIRATVWTFGLMAVLFLVDRGVLGPLARRGWLQVTRIEEVPARVATIQVPAYFPKFLTWPPNRIFYREEPAPKGWWLESTAQDGARAYLGAGVAALPERIAEGTPEVRACLETEKCPSGWYLLSRLSAQGQTLYLITNLPRVEGQRILQGLK